MAMSVEISSITVTSGMEFRCRTAGPETGEPVICLHGFPETSVSFFPLLKAACSFTHVHARSLGGYRVVAFDQRGYSPGARPTDVAEYDYPLIVDDVIAVADALGFERFHLVGHDHGCIVGWCVAAKYQERVASYTPMSVPHPRAFADALMNDPDQTAASQYFHTFAQAQGTVLRGMVDMFSKGMVEGPHKGKGFEDIKSVLFDDPTGAPLRAALNWYNGVMESGLLPCPPVLKGSAMDGSTGFSALMNNWTGSKPLENVEVPVLFLWGTEDGALKRAGVDATAACCDGEYELVTVPCGHSMMQEAGDECITQIFKHVGRNSLRSAKALGARMPATSRDGPHWIGGEGGTASMGRTVQRNIDGSLPAKL